MKTTEELAELIKDKVDRLKSESMPPEDQHLLKAATEVTEHLGMKPDVVNVGHVASLIRDHIELEYPKMLYSKTQPVGMHYEKVVLNTPDGPVTAYGVLVSDEKEEKDLEGDWFESAHRASGIEVEKPVEDEPASEVKKPERKKPAKGEDDKKGEDE